MRAYTFLRLALILFFLFSAQPVLAVIESVSPSTPAVWSNAQASGATPGQFCSNAEVAFSVMYPSHIFSLPFGSWITPEYTFSCVGTDNTGSVVYNMTIYGALVVPASCPVSSPSYVYNVSSGMCERTVVSSCTAAAGAVLSSGFFDVGTSPTVSPSINVCKNLCSATYSGDGVGFRRLVNGVFHYYAQGEYRSSGLACNGEPNLTAETITTLGGDSCAPGQSSITMGGKTKCFNSDGSIASSASASAVAASQSLKDAQIASAVQAAGNSMSSSGGSSSDVQAAKSVAAGVMAANGTSGQSNSGDPVLDGFCAQNPTASICVEKDFGTVDDSVLTNQNINVAINPVSVGGAGSCPAPTAMVLHGQTYYFEWTTYCNFANGIRPILLAFAWLSAAGLMVGGFKSA